MDEPNSSTEIVSWEKNQIIFKANKSNRKTKESIGIHIRGKLYELENFFTYNPSELESNQEIFTEISLGRYIELKGSNFILNRPNNNKLLIEPGGIKGTIMGIAPEKAIVQLEIDELSPASRISYISMYNADIKSKNSAKLTISNPTLPYSKHDNVVGTDYNDLDMARGININDRTFFIWRNKILEYEAEEKSLKEIISIQIGSHNLANAFAVTSLDGKVYMGSYNREYYWDYLRIFEFDTNNNTIKELPKSPSNITSPRYVYVHKNQLYIDGGFIRYIFRDEETSDRYRLDLNSLLWEKLQQESPLTDFNRMMSTFHFQERLYAIGNLTFNGDQVLQEFDINSLNWNTIKTLGEGGGLKTNQPCILGNDLILFNQLDPLKINMITLKKENLKNMSSRLYWSNLLGTVTSNGKIYTYMPGLLIYETDPEFLIFEEF